MLQGIYVASQGMTTLMDKQDQIAHNLANINTTGFKQSGLFAQAYNKFLADDQAQPFVNHQVKPDQTYIDFSEGTLKKTANVLDCSIKGDGFFTVLTPQGVRYSRNGNFSLNAEGFLVTGDGSKVVGREGFIRLNNTDQVVISKTGEVMQGNVTKGVLKMADFDKPYQLLRHGDSYFSPKLKDNPVRDAAGFELNQGYLETSNVDPVTNMVKMISSYRSFEACQKALRSQDETLDKSVNQVGKL